MAVKTGQIGQVAGSRKSAGRLGSSQAREDTNTLNETRTSSRSLTLHPYAWLAWLAAAATPALLTRNPIYLSVLLLAAGLTYRVLARERSDARGWQTFIRLGVLLSLLTIPFNALTVHVGEIVILRLPATWPVIGGAITVEAAVYGLVSGLGLLAILLIFVTFNMALDPGRLLRLVPASLYQAGIITVIAVTFVPQMMRALQEIREAQEIRGHRFRGLRDLLPLFVPLLTLSLERAIQLAESMEARGFGGAPVSRRGSSIWLQALTLILLGWLAVGLFAYGYWRSYRLEAGMAISVALGGLIGILWAIGRQSPRTRYRRWLWRPRDAWVTAVGALATMGILGAWLLDRTALIYYPYPPFGLMPQVRPWLLVLMTVPALPALLAVRLRGLPRWKTSLASPSYPAQAHEPAKAPRGGRAHLRLG